jgi:hypothetical protein
VVGFCLLLPRLWNKCRTGIVENSILSCAKQQRKFNVLSKSYKGSLLSQVTSGKLGSNYIFQLSKFFQLYHELIRTLLTLHS